MASEDSDQITSGRLAIHRFSDFGDFNKTVDIKMPIVRSHSHATGELLEVTPLRRTERLSLKERNYRSQKLIPPVHDELTEVLTMVVVTFADVDPPDAKEAVELLQRRSAPDALRHYKPVSDLIASSVASAILPTRLSDKPDGEATLSVHKANDPANLNQSFLLISCTRHIVTVPPA